jgi:hypothetical protein
LAIGLTRKFENQLLRMRLQRMRLQKPIQTAVESELLIRRLSALLIKARGSLGVMERTLTAEERERVLKAVDCFETLTDRGVDELRGCVEELERLLEFQG